MKEGLAVVSSVSLKTLILGGGPAGLYFALLLKKEQSDAEVTLLERNRPGDTFGWGVVFSDQTVGNLMDADRESAHHINAAFNHWDDIEIHFKGSVIRSSGHGFIGIGRKKILNILQDRCRELGVHLVFETDVQDIEKVISDYAPDLVIAADGLNSRTRKLYEATYQPDIDVRRNRFVWLGTHAKYDAFTFDLQQTEHGWFQAHIYQFDDQTSTFISPLTNKRTDQYGGDLENRLRYPIEVFQAIREVWPADKPISVRISAHDWVEGGITPDDAVEIAKHFKAAGADMIDCSSGQVSKQEKPVYGRMFQTPFADRVRNEAGIPTIAVGNIFEAE